jgi:GNAT superfamily N-acetyltransferase
VTAVLELFRDVFGKPTSEALYRWKFFEAPRAIGAPTSFVALAAGRIVGHFGGTPLRVRLVGGEVPAIHGGWAMVAEPFRRRGILSALIRTANDAWASGGSSLQLAIPTQNVYGLRDRLDYRPTVQLGWLWRPLWRAFDRLGSRVLETAPAHATDSVFDELWDGLTDHEGALVVRDRDWIEYRYGAARVDYRILLAREQGGRPLGYAVYRVMPGSRRSAWIVDLLGSNEARPALLRSAFATLRSAGAADVRVFAVRESSLWSQLRRSGFVPRRGAYDVRVVPYSCELPWNVLRDPRRFFLMGGDFDVI